MTLSRSVFSLILLLLGSLSLATASAAKAQEPDFSGAWISSCMGSTLEATVVQEETHIKGVAYVFTFGEKNAYHFTGTIQDGRIHATHYSGHTFDGRLLPTGEIEGTLVTGEKGHRLDLVARRAPLRK